MTELTAKTEINSSSTLPNNTLSILLHCTSSHRAYSMSSSLDLTRDWLRNVLKPYPARDRVLPEVMEILTNRRTLSVKTDAFS